MAENRALRAACLAALAFAVGGPAKAQAPQRAGYADPSGLVKPAEPYPDGKTADLPAPKALPEPCKSLPIDLPYALHLANASNPTIAIAQVRVEEAYTRFQQARVAWLPDLWAGGNPNNLSFLPTYYVHNGPIQNSRGQVFDVVKAEGSFPVGAGLNLSFADALFGPRIARDLVSAEQARARVVVYNVQLDVALTYLDLLRAYGALAINREMLSKAEVIYDAASAAEREGFGKTTADANRARTEVEIRRQERIDLEADAATASARLAQLLLLEPTVDLVPADAAVLPIELVPDAAPLDELIGVGLMNRPELAESRALVAAALARWREEKTRPLLPTLQMAYYGAQFGGGTPALHDFGWRDDFMVQASWEVRNAGLGSLFSARGSRLQYNEANLHVTEVQAMVAADVTAAAKVARAREREFANAQEAVRQAEVMWDKLQKAAFGAAGTFGGGVRRFDPLEPLLAEQQLHDARLRYLDEVISYNRTQFRLYWAMGQPPLCALPRATAVPVQTPVLPSAEQQAKPATPTPRPAQPDKPE